MSAQVLLPQPNQFNALVNGRQVQLFYLQNEQLKVALTNYGARVVSLLVPDRAGESRDVVVGFDSIDGYLNAKELYHGAIVGRYANRIADGRFSLNGSVYELPVNNGKNHLHGGPGGFHHQVWELQSAAADATTFFYTSPDGEEGYPGTVTIFVHYQLTGTQLEISYEATTTADTIINLTNHSYFNLDGQGAGSIYDHTLCIQAQYITAVDKDLIPTGELMAVSDTAFDFRQARRIGEGINSNHEQIRYGAGYDHNYVLDNNRGAAPAAQVFSAASGIVLTVFTDQPGVQLYTGNFMRGEHLIKHGKRDTHQSAFCLETQHFPDSPNQPQFPSTVLKKGETFRSQTVYAFAVK